MLIFKFLPFSTVLRFQISPFLDTLRWDSDGSRITEFQTEATPKDYRITEFQTEAVKKITGLPNFKLRDYRITQFQKRLPNFFVRSKSRTPPTLTVTAIVTEVDVFPIPAIFMRNILR